MRMIFSNCSCQIQSSPRAIGKTMHHQSVRDAEVHDVVSRKRQHPETCTEKARMHAKHQYWCENDPVHDGVSPTRSCMCFNSSKCTTCTTRTELKCIGSVYTSETDLKLRCMDSLSIVPDDVDPPKSSPMQYSHVDRISGVKMHVRV